jgi:hypothetical protein
MAVALTAIRVLLRVLPPPLRERLAVRLFMTNRDHGEPEREALWRARGSAVMVAGCNTVAFGPEEGPVALLMHGWEGRGLQLSAFIEPLMARGMRVIAMDGPGHGRTPGMGGLPTFADALERAIAEVQPQCIIAHSVGASAAIVAASRTDYGGRILCLAGPPDSQMIFMRARAFLQLPERGRPRFVRYLGARFPVRIDDVMDIAAAARRLRCKLHAILVEGDTEFPVEESRAIIEPTGKVTVLSGPTHRSVMWDPTAVDAGLRALGLGRKVVARR